jgi:hypothetical protein
VQGGEMRFVIGGVADDGLDQQKSPDATYNRTRQQGTSGQLRLLLADEEAEVATDMRREDRHRSVIITITITILTTITTS